MEPKNTNPQTSELELTSRTFHVNRRGPLYYLTIPSFEETGMVRHCFSTRRGGASQGIYASMNLSFRNGDSRENVEKNLGRIQYVTDIAVPDMVMSHQVHADRIINVNQDQRGCGITRPVLDGYDGMITNCPHVALVTFHADCVPVFLLDPQKKAIGMVHAGWKGTALEIAGKAVLRMKEDFGSDPASILAAIGPSCGPSCYEVGEEVAQIFHSVFDSAYHAAMAPFIREPVLKEGERQDHYLASLWEANRISLMRAGVLPGHITVTDLCTHCHPDYFFSHRRMGTQRGLQAAFLELVG